MVKLVPLPVTLRKRLNGVAREGYDMAPSETIGRVIDIAFPVSDQYGYAKASLFAPLLPVIGRTPDPETVKATVAEAAERVSNVLIIFDRVQQLFQSASHTSWALRRNPKSTA
jgi:DNA-binding IclR family transcriptional regulator